ncbi:MAG: hypothetical protein ABNG98_05835 [Flavobacterium sp.]|jgi:hypothetical protein
MKAKFVLLIILFSSILIGCKDEKSVDNLEVVKHEVADDLFRVTLKVIVKKQDDFALFYTEDGSVNFFDVKPIWQGVKSSDVEQDVTFVLPQDVFPSQLRFDLGLKEDQEDITIIGIKITHKGSVFEAYGADFFTYFRADENQCKVDQVTGIVTANYENGKRKVPSIYPHQAILGKKLENFGL